MRPSSLLQILKQIEDLRLHRDVERRDRLIADEEIGAERQGAGDADALALAARKAVRVARQEARIEADRLHQGFHDLSCAGTACRDLVDLERLAEDVLHRHARDSSELNGSWNTIWMRAPEALQLVAFDLEQIDLAFARNRR